MYVLALVLSAILHQGDTNVWHSGVRTFPWFERTRASLASVPPSPVRQIQQKPFHLAAPRPQRPVRQATLERDLEYGLERPRGAPSYEPSRRAPAAPSNNQTTPSLYPAYLKSNLPSQPGISEPSGATPPPLGDWPRSSRKPTRDASPSAFSSSGDTSAQSQQPETSAPARPTHPRKGSNGSPSRQRPVPPPLDLTRISAYRTIDGRVSRR